jgi:hypothetical protein
LGQLPVRAVLTTGRGRRSSRDPGRCQRRGHIGCSAWTCASRSRCRCNPRWSRHCAEVARSRRAAGVHPDGPRSAGQHCSGAPHWSGHTAQQEINSRTDCHGCIGDSRTPAIHSSSSTFCECAHLGT